jgi:hypothetical protein
MAHTQEELVSYKHKAEILFSIFGDKSWEAVNQVIWTLENILRWDDSEFVAIELGYWFNVEVELKKIMKW